MSKWGKKERQAIHITPLDQIPLLRSRPGGVHQELVVWDLP